VARVDESIAKPLTPIGGPAERMSFLRPPSTIFRLVVISSSPAAQLMNYVQPTSIPILFEGQTGLL
jgi:hypothetical protein